MKRRLWISILLVAGCAHQPTTYEQLRAAEVAMKGVDVRQAQDVKTWSRGVDARIAHCRSLDLETEGERERCMGVYGRGDELEADAEALARAYDAIVEQLHIAKQAAKRLQALYDEAQGEGATGEE